MIRAGIEYRPWPRHPRYLVGEDGSVIGPYGRLRKPQLGPRGYLLLGVWINGKGVTAPVHIMVAEAWHGSRPDGHEVAHGNGVSTDNRAVNLRWATPAANNADKIQHGTASLGGRHGGAKLTESDVRAIRDAYLAGTTQPVLAERYGVSVATVSDLVRGRTWSHIPLTAPVFDGRQRNKPVPGRALGERNGHSRLTADAVRDIRSSAAAGVATSVLARRYGVGWAAVQGVLAGRTWGHVA